MRAREETFRSLWHPREDLESEKMDNNTVECALQAGKKLKFALQVITRHPFFASKRGVRVGKQHFSTIYTIVISLNGFDLESSNRMEKSVQ